MCSVQFSHSFVSDCDSMDCSMPGFPVHHQLPDLNSCPLRQWCHPTISSSVVPFSCPQSFTSIRVFSNESVLHIRWPKYDMLRTSKCKHWKQFHIYDYVQFHTNLYSKEYKGTDSLKYFTILKYIEAWRPINYRFRRGMMVIQTRELGAVKNLIQDRF